MINKLDSVVPIINRIFILDQFDTLKLFSQNIKDPFLFFISNNFMDSVKNVIWHTLCHETYNQQKQ